MLLAGVATTCALVGGLALASAPALAAHAFSSSFTGSPGTPVNEPLGIYVDGAAGAVLVGDLGNDTVDQFNLAGAPKSFSSLSSNMITGVGAPQLFAQVIGVADAPGGGDIYAVDATNNVVDVFNPAGEYVSQLTGEGSPAESFSKPVEVRVDPSTKDVWVVDKENNVVDEFAPEEEGKKFKYVTQITPSSLAEPLIDLQDVAVDSEGGVYVGGLVVEGAVERFQTDKFKSTGAFEAVFDPAGGNSVTVDTSTTPNDVYVLEGPGNLIGEFEATSATGVPSEQFEAPEANELRDIAVDSTTHSVYATDLGHNLVDIFTASGGGPKFALTVKKTGTGEGTVTSSPPGINCGAKCTGEFEEGKEVTLTAKATGSTFGGWSGACSGTGPCKVTMSEAEEVTAEFTALSTVPLTVSITGKGEVTSTPPGIECGAKCTEEFEAGDVTLTETPAEGYEFAGWIGCRSTGETTCEVSLIAATEVTAVFLKGGEQGATGPPGKTGVPGATGVPGKQGAAGTAGATGANGNDGAQGPPGANGAQGPTGAQGPAGAAGKIELVTCKTVKKGGKSKQQCTTKLVSGTVKFTAVGSSAHATLSRHGAVYAAGTARSAHGHMQLRLATLRRLRPGRYTLTLISGAGSHVSIHSESFTLS